jgi:hypothetical protein
LSGIDYTNDYGEKQSRRPLSAQGAARPSRDVKVPSAEDALEERQRIAGLAARDAAQALKIEV